MGTGVTEQRPGELVFFPKTFLPFFFLMQVAHLVAYTDVLLQLQQHFDAVRAAAAAAPQGPDFVAGSD